MQIEVHELELRYAALRIRDAGRAARMRASLAADGQQSPVSVIASVDDRWLSARARRVRARVRRDRRRTAVDGGSRRTHHGASTRSVHRLRRSDLAKLERGWAISIHKAQRSAFRHVILPLASSPLLDRALVYTAVTRATQSVVLVGEVTLLRTATEAQPMAAARRVALRLDFTPR
jgi:hypothetical protein